MYFPPPYAAFHYQVPPPHMRYRILPYHSPTGVYTAPVINQMNYASPTSIIKEETVIKEASVQSVTGFTEQVNDLLYKQPLIIHTQILPFGVRADDPRLLTASVISEKSYIVDYPIFPNPIFTATIHPSLIPTTEAEERVIVPD